DGKSTDLTPIHAASAHIERLSPVRANEVLIAVTDPQPSRSGLYVVDLQSSRRTLLLKDEGFQRVFVDAHFCPRVAVRAVDSLRTEILHRTDDGKWLSDGISPAPNASNCFRS